MQEAGESSGDFIDVHTHLADPRLNGPILGEILGRSRAAGITAWVQGGVGPDDWDRQLRLAGEQPGIYPCFGLHPWWVAEHSEVEIEHALATLESLLDRSVGVGELGLDHGPRGGGETSRPRQLAAFQRQLDLADRREKPLVLHVVQAHEEALKVLEARAGGRLRSGIVHSFSGNATIAERYLALGLSLSISGGVARKGFETLKRAVVRLPADRLLIETDSPDQGPQAHVLNEPANLRETARAVAALRGESPDEVLRRSTENARRIFLS